MSPTLAEVEKLFADLDAQDAAAVEGGSKPQLNTIPEPIDEPPAQDAPTVTMGGEVMVGELTLSDAIDKLFEEDEKQKDATIAEFFEKVPGSPYGQSVDINKRAIAYDMMTKTGAPSTDILNHFDEFLEAWDQSQRDPRKYRQQFPELARVALENPEAASIIVGDQQLSIVAHTMNKLADVSDWADEELSEAGLQPISPEQLAENKKKREEGMRTKPKAQNFLETKEVQEVRGMNPAIRDIVIPYKRYLEADAQMELSKLQFTLLRQREFGASPDAIFETQRQIHDIKRTLIPGNYQEDALTRVFSDASEAIASQVHVFKDAGAGAVTGALVGYAIGARLGQGKRGAKIGAGLLGRVGGFEASLRLEAGGAYAEFAELKLDNGQPLSDEAARHAALGYGFLAAGVELGGFEVGLKAFTGAAGRLTFKNKLKDAGFRQAAIELGKAWLKAGAGEMGEEGIQAALEQFSGYLAVSKAQGKASSQQFRDVEEVLLSSQKGAVGGLAMSTAGLVITPIVANARRNRALLAGQQLAALAGLKDSPTVVAAPELAAEIIRDQTTKSGAPLTHVYVDPNELTTLFQGASVDPKELLGEKAPEVLKEAMATGQKVEVPVAEYLSTWSNKEIDGTSVAEHLQIHTTTSPSLPTLAEQKVLDKQAEQERKLTEKRAEELVKQYETKEGISLVERQVLDRLEQQLAATGTYDKKTAAQALAPLRAFVETQAERFGVTADELFADVVMAVEREGGPAQEGQALSEQVAQPAKAKPTADQLKLLFPDTETLSAMRDDFTRAERPEQLTRFYIDANTGLLNKRALTRMKRPEGRPFLAKLGLDGGKLLNDFHGHEALDGALRAMAQQLRAEGIGDAVRDGGDLVVWVKSRGQAGELASKLSKKLGLPVIPGVSQGLPSLDNTRKAAGDDAKRRRETGRKKGEFGHRKGAPPSLLAPDSPAIAYEKGEAGLPLDSQEAQLMLKAAAEKAAPLVEGFKAAKAVEGTQLGEELLEAFDTMEGDPFDLIYREDSGLLTEEGFELARKVRPKKYAASGDMRALGALNEAFGKEGADRVVDEFKAIIAAVARGRFDAAHPHGDEFLFQWDDQGELRRFLRAVEEEALKTVFVQEQADGSVILHKGIQFAAGIRENLQDADRVALPEAKKAQVVHEPIRFESVEEADRAAARLEAARYRVTRLARRDDQGHLEAREGARGGRTGAELTEEEVAALLRPSPEMVSKAREHAGKMREDRRDWTLQYIAYAVGERDKRPQPADTILKPWVIIRTLAAKYGVIHRDDLPQLTGMEKLPGNSRKKFGDPKGAEAGIAEDFAEMRRGRPKSRMDAATAMARLSKKNQRNRKEEPETYQEERLEELDDELDKDELDQPGREEDEPRNLLVQHNLTEENLLHADKLGGLAAPSLAVARVEHPLANFGDITLLAPKELADPKAGVPVHDADIYTPRYPSVVFQVDAKKARKLIDYLAPFAKQTGSYVANLDNEIEQDGVDVVGAGTLAPALQLAFLTEKGVKVETPMREARLRSGLSRMPALREFFKTRGIDSSFAPDSEYHAAMSEAAKRAVDEYAADLEQKLLASGDTAEEARATAQDIANDERSAMFTDDALDFARADRLTSDAAKVDAKEIDVGALKQALEAAIEKAGRAEYDAWAKGQVESVIKSEKVVQITPSGNRKLLPHTIDNVVKTITRKLQAGEGFDYGPGSIRASGAKRYRSIDEVKKERDRIIPEAEMRKVKDDINGRFVELANRLGGRGAISALSTSISESYKRGRSLERELAKDGYTDVDAALLRDIEDFARELIALPTEYFEAKPQRAVALSEFTAAVVPEGTSPAALAVLKKHGITTIETYEKGDEESRRKAVDLASRGRRLLFSGPRVPGDPDGKHRGYVTFNRPGEKRTFRIRLTKDADLSTFLHESGHVFLELMGDLAARPSAPQSVKDDYAQALKWMGVERREDIKREHHEKFAEAFEKYLMKGKSPSPKLEGVFAAFRAWLLSLYRGIRDDVLSDDIRGVFDRMLATDDEINRAAKGIGMRRIFATPEEAGMSPAEWKQYLEDLEKATSYAKRQLEHRAIQDRLRETESWWKDELAREMKAAEKLYEELPARKAQKFLRGKHELNDTPVILARAEVEAAVGPLNARKFRTAMKGSHIDGVASIVGGFQGGQQMLAAIIQIPSMEAWTEEYAEQRMREKHGDIIEDTNKLQELADKGVHGEFTSAWFAREMKALRKKAGIGGDMPLDAIKRAAQELVRKRRIGSIRPNLFLQAERAAARKAFDRAAQQDFLQAYVFRQQQLLNHFMYKAAVEQLEQTDAAFKYLQKRTGDQYRAALNKASAHYLNLHDGILAALGMARQYQDTKTVLASLEAAIIEATNAGNPFAFDVAAIRELLVTPQRWNELFPDKALNVRDAIAQVRALANEANEVRLFNEKMAIEDVAAKIEVESAELLPDLGKKPAAEQQVPKLRKGFDKLLGVIGETMDAEEIFGMLGPTARAIFDRYLGAKTHKYELAKELLDPLMKRWEELPAETMARRFERIAELDQDLPIPEDINLGGPRDRLWLIMVALNSGNASNMERLTGGLGWTEQQVLDALNKHLTRDEWAWVESIWKLMDEKLYPLVAAKEERKNGLPPEKIQARPIVTPYGVVSGGYFPAVYEAKAAMGDIGERQEQQAIASLYGPGYVRASTLKSHTKERAVHYENVMRLDWSVVPSHFAQVLHDIAFDEFVRETGRIIFHPKVEQSLYRRLGEKRANSLRDWLKFVANAQANAGAKRVSETGALLGALKSILVIGAIGWSIPTAMGDFANAFVAMARGRKDGGTDPHFGVVAYLAALPLSPTYGFLRRMALEKSDELKNRLAARREEKRQQYLNAIKNRAGRLSRAREAVANTAWFFMEQTDKMASTQIWLARYWQEKSNGKGEQQAVELADAAVRGNLTSPEKAEQSALVRDPGVAGAVLVFFGYFAKLSGIVRAPVRRGVRAWMGVKRAEKGKKGAAFTHALDESARVAGKVMAIMFFAQVVGELLSGRGPEEDEEKEDWLLRKALASPLTLVPFGSNFEGFANQLITGHYRKTSIRAAPAMSVFESVFKNLGKAADESKDDSERAWAAIEVLLTAAGLPAKHPVRTGKFLEALLNDEEQADGLGEMNAGLMYGERKRQPDNPVTFFTR